MHEAFESFNNSRDHGHSSQHSLNDQTFNYPKDVNIHPDRFFATKDFEREIFDLRHWEKVINSSKFNRKNIVSILINL